MDTKLTLTIDQLIIEKAKIYALKKERSLSDLIENFLKIVVRDEQINEKELSPIVKNLKGSFEMPKDFDYKKDLTKQLSDKYLK